MRPTRCFTVTPGRPGLPAWTLGGVFLLALASGQAYGAEFGSPLILTHPDPPVEGQAHGFGSAVVIDGDVLAIAGRTHLRDGVFQGEVFIYERRRKDPNRWRLSRRLLSSRLGPGGLALDDRTLAVAGTRSILLYERDDAGVWRRRRTLRPKLPGFPGAMSLDGDRLAVGLPSPLAKVLVFERDKPSRGRWGITARIQGELTAPVFQQTPEVFELDSPAPGFGEAVAISGDRLAVGAISTHVCCGKAGPTSNSVFVFARDPQSPEGWTQLHNFESPGRRGTVVGQSVHDDVPFGQRVVLSGPVLLAGEGFREGVGEFGLGEVTMHLYEQNHRGPDGWGYRRELRPGRTARHLSPRVSALRGNTAAVAESSGENAAIRVFERDHPVRDVWGLRNRLPTEFWDVQSEVVALGPRELVAGGSGKVLIYPRRPILEDGFESGTFTKWTNAWGYVEVVSPGLGGSDSALAVEVGSGRAVLASNRPRREPSVSLSFSLFPNAVNLGGRRVEIFRLFANKPALRLSLEEGVTDPDYRAVLEVRLRDGSWQQVGRARFRPDREAVIGIEYSAATAAGAGDGATRFEVNGHLIREARRLDLDRALIGRAVVGLPQGSPLQASSGSFLIDDFVMHR